ncbi:MAG: FKBP-type peptidyl-prolyl cis-trans isomerase [Balneola sp.]|nr:MAG: FKBP-type peptidyl-prolyl cis-trans isomerase [Balneola sp.]
MFNKRLFIFILSAFFAVTACSQPENSIIPNSELNTMPDSVSYALGFQNGKQLSTQGFPDVDIEIFLSGFQDGLEGEDSKLNEANLQLLFQRFGDYLLDKIKLENDEEARIFFEENRTKEGVIETPSGLQYKVLREGTGIQPTSQDTVVVHYEGTLIDGTVFDSSYDGGQPAEFVLGAVIPGWIEGVGLMSEGASYMLYIPTELAYRDNPRPGGAIKPNDAIIFKVELLEVRQR